ncbi:MAG TPA: hypothetical protein VKX39_02725 [Bryobacteraceae bacterium]|jgi:hypothetical protein|nr:hypothetical protein [Bryobacteraceae bacterium]
MALQSSLDPSQGPAQAEFPAPPQTRTERGLRRVLIVFAILAAAALAVHLALLLWAQNAFSGPESVVAGQALTLAHEGKLYNDLNRSPYTVCAYTPLFYAGEAALSKTGLPTETAGRLISFAALLGIIALSRRIVLHYTSDRYCGWLAAILAGSTSLLSYWGTIGQVDTLAVFFSLAAFYFFSQSSLAAAGIFAALAFFTKQTALAAPAAIFVLLWLERKKIALRFALALFGAVATAAAAIDFATGGRFFADTIRANINPFALQKLKQHAIIFVGAGQLILIAAAGFKPAWRAARPLFVYLGFALAVFALTAAKVGSDTNYQIESTVALILCACLSLHALDFFPLTFAGSKKWVTLLQIPLAIHLVLNLRMTKNLLLERVAVEQQFRTEISALRSYADSGRLLSADYNASLQLRGGMEVEPLIYNMLVQTGVIDPEPLRRDLAAQKFSTILLFEDLNHPGPAPDRETSTLPPAQLQEIRRHYRLLARIESPYPSRVFVYKPVP